MSSSTNATYGFGEGTLTGLDLSQHNNLVHTIITVNAAFLAIVVFMVGTRIAVRLMIVKRLGLDDIFMAIAALFAIGLSTVFLVGIKCGLGRHVWDLDLLNIIHLALKDVQILFICSVLYATAVTFTKISIIVSYLRIFPQPWFKKLMYFTVFIVASMWICSVCVTIFECRPVDAAWDFRIKHGVCVDIQAYFYVAAGINIATDLLLCTIPLPLFWRLNIAFKERCIICVLFAFGIFATISSCLRLSQLHQLSSSDISYRTIPPLIWSVVEVGIGIVCSCVPCMKPLISRFWPGRFFTMPGRYGTAGSRRPGTGRSGAVFSENSTGGVGAGAGRGDKSTAGRSWKPSFAKPNIATSITEKSLGSSTSPSHRDEHGTAFEMISSPSSRTRISSRPQNSKSSIEGSESMRGLKTDEFSVTYTARVYSGSEEDDFDADDGDNPRHRRKGSEGGGGGGRWGREVI